MRPAWQVTPEGLELRVRVSPRARRAAVGGLHAGADSAALMVAVREAPSDGAANDAARRALAEALAVPPSALRLLRGARSRDKLFAVAGDPDRLAGRLSGLLR